MKTRTLNEVTAYGSGNGRHVTNVFHHGRHCNGRHHENGREVKFCNHKLLQAHQLGGRYGSKVDERYNFPAGIHHRCAAGIGNHCHNVRSNHTQQDGNDLNHPLAPNVRRNDDHHGNQRQPPAAGCIGNCRRRQIQADEDDDGARYHRGQEAHHLPHPNQLNNRRQNHIQKASHHNTAQGVRQLLRPGHIGVNPGIQVGHCLEATQIGERGAQKSRNLQLRTDMKKQRANSCKQQRRLDGQGQSVALDQNWHQHRGAKHGKHVLEPQNEHLG